MTALHWSCYKGFSEISEFLIQNHADVNAKDTVLIILS